MRAPREMTFIIASLFRARSGTGRAAAARWIPTRAIGIVSLMRTAAQDPSMRRASGLRSEIGD